MNPEIKKLAADFVKGKNPKNALGCYITKDGSVFYRDHVGLNFAKSHIGNSTDIYEFNGKGELVDPNAEIEEAPSEAGNDDGTISLDQMKRDELIALFNELDPTRAITKETKEQLKDLIVAANTLTDYDDAKLIEMVKALNSNMIAEGMSNEDVSKVMSTEELKAIVLNLRDEVEISQEINDKLFAIGDGE